MGHELWCATSTSSEKVAQLRKVSQAEYCFGKQEGDHVRVSGSCTISMDNDDKMKLYDAIPILKKFIEDPSSPDYVVIRMKPDRIRFMEKNDLAYVEVPLT